jgi:hypothetical protein
MTNGKIGIFVSGQHGDIAMSTAILKYKDVIWPGKDVVCMKDLEKGYFSAPWAVLPSPKFGDIHYAEIPKIIFGIDPSWEWHPYLKFSDEEREAAKEFCGNLPHAKTIMLETQLISAGNFNRSDSVIRDIMQLCRNKFGKCNFIFASKIDHSKYVDDLGVVSASHFTVRQTALVHNHCDLFIGVCSGITISCCCWDNKPVPRIETCGATTSTIPYTNGPSNSVFCENLPVAEIDRRLILALEETLNKM